MTEPKQSPSASQLSDEKKEIEALDDFHVPALHVQHLHATEKELEELKKLDDAKVKEARNAAFTAAVSTGSTDPWSKSALVLYACE